MINDYLNSLTDEQIARELAKYEAVEKAKLEHLTKNAEKHS